MVARNITSVREQLWVLAHDEDDGLRPRIDVRALGVGLLGATLVDLLLLKRIQIHDGRVYLYGTRALRDVNDPIASGVLYAITNGGGPPLAGVLRGSHAEARDDTPNPYAGCYDRTLAGLINAGVVVTHRRRLRATRYALDDIRTAQWMRNHFSRRLWQREPDADPARDSLCALAWALGLHSTLLLPFSTGDADLILRDVIAQIPQRVGRRSVLTTVPHIAEGVRHAVGDLATAVF